MFADFTVMMKAGLWKISCIIIELDESTAKQSGSRAHFRLSWISTSSSRHTLRRIHDLPLSVLFNLNLQFDVLDVFENLSCQRLRDWESAPAPCSLPSKKREPSTYIFDVGLVRNMHSF